MELLTNPENFFKESHRDIVVLANIVDSHLRAIDTFFRSVENG